MKICTLARVSPNPVRWPNRAWRRSCRPHLVPGCSFATTALAVPAILSRVSGEGCRSLTPAARIAGRRRRTGLQLSLFCHKYCVNRTVTQRWLDRPVRPGTAATRCMPSLQWPVCRKRKTRLAFDPGGGGRDPVLPRTRLRAVRTPVRTQTFSRRDRTSLRCYQAGP